jgi:hypothetical protein
MSGEENIHFQRRDDAKYRKRVCFYNHASYFYECKTTPMKKKNRLDV